MFNATRSLFEAAAGRTGSSLVRLVAETALQT